MISIIIAAGAGLLVGLAAGFWFGHTVATGQAVELQSVFDSHWQGYVAELEGKVSDLKRSTASGTS